MSIYQKIQQKTKDYLATSPSKEELRKFFDKILQQESPTEAFHQTHLEKLKEPRLFFTQLMVQDIRQTCYSSPFIVQEPFSSKSKLYFFKYGHKQLDFQPSQIQTENFYSYLVDRQTVVCMPVAGETQWSRDVEKNTLKTDVLFQMIVDQIGIFKLGEVFNSICVYDPEDKILHFVRKATQQQVKLWTNSEEYLSKQINYQLTRAKLLKLFNTIYEERYSQYLLFSIISTDHFFISATENHSQLFRKLLPRVNELKVQAPFKQSFFPYKNEEQLLVKTEMQLSQNHTFVILDFSNVSPDNEVKIGPEEIDNIKALKVFVEQGSTIYRWLYGQSLIKHTHTGLVVKASSIINPQYIIPEKVQEKKPKQIPEIQQTELRNFRSYIHQVRKIDSILKDDRKEIQEKIHSQTIKFNEISLVKVMELSKLSARSFGRDQIKVSDFDNSCSLFF